MKVKDLKSILSPNSDNGKLEKTARSLVVGIAKAAQGIVEFFDEHPDTIESLIKYFEKFEEIEKEKIQELMNRSWFIDGELCSDSEMTKCVALFREGKEKEANQFLEQCYIEIIPDLEKRILNRYPKREQIFSHIFEAYRMGLYGVVIPTIFAQVDGICKDEFGGEFFRTENKAPKASKNIDSEDTFWSIWALPLLTTHGNAVMMCETYRDKLEKIIGEIYLNRHAIIHGEDYQYATKSKALRAFSLLGYIDSLAIAITEEKAGL